jgi:hypothetical protein
MEEGSHETLRPGQFLFFYTFLVACRFATMRLNRSEATLPKLLVASRLNSTFMESPAVTDAQELVNCAASSEEQFSPARQSADKHREDVPHARVEVTVEWESTRRADDELQETPV